MRFSFFILFVALFITSCAPVNTGPQVSDQLAYEEAMFQQSLVIDHERAKIDRIKAVGLDVLSANSQFCYDEGDKVYHENGLYFSSHQLIRDGWNLFASLTDRDQWKERQIKAYPQILYVTPGSPADGKIKAGDEIVAINDFQLSDDTLLIDNIESYADEINSSLKQQGSYQLTVKRAGKRLNHRIEPVAVCPYPVYVLIDDRKESDEEYNAYTDGKSIFISTSIANLTDSDSQLALIVGHELAHAHMGHVDKKMTNQALGAVADISFSILTGVNMTNFQREGVLAHSHEFEHEADYYGLYMMANAGYSVEGTPEFWRIMAVKRPVSIHIEGGLTHPSTAKRFIALKQTAEEINMMDKSQFPLLPKGGEVDRRFDVDDANDASYND